MTSQLPSPRSSGWASTCNLTICCFQTLKTTYFFERWEAHESSFVISCRFYVCFRLQGFNHGFCWIWDLRSQQFLVCTSALACTALGTFVDCTSRRRTTSPNGQKHIFHYIIFPLFQSCSMTTLRELIYSIISSKDSREDEFPLL